MSYVLVNWNTEELLPRALDSIAGQAFAYREVILVNNASPNFGNLDLSGYELTLVEAGSNLGFAGGNNLGIARSNGDIVILVNCDAALDPQFTRHAVRVFNEQPRVGTVVPKILRDDMSGIIDSTGHVMREDRTALNRGSGELDNGQYDKPGPVFGGTAAAIAYRREMLEQLSRDGEVFCHDFFAYYEDVDLDWRARLAGWQAFFEPQCRATHRGHASGGRSSLRIQRIAEKNRYLMLWRNDSIASQLTCIIPLAIYEAWHLCRTLLRPWLWLAYLDLLICLPRALAYRAWARAGRRIPQAIVASEFVPRGSTLPPIEEGRAEQPAAAAYPLVSIVIINYNGLGLTRACLESARLQSYQPCEIIVIDNGSAADEARILDMEFPDVRILRLERNLGFSGGVNWAVSLASGEYIALVNNDCVMDQDCIRQLMFAQRKTQAAAVSGRLVDIGASELILPLLSALALEEEDGVLWELPPAAALAMAESQRNHGISLYGYVVTELFGNRDECFHPSGGLCLVQRSSVEEWLPQFFPQQYFAYQEDVWLGFALRTAGSAVVKAPRAAAVHLASSTARHLGRPRLRFLQERNRISNLICWLPAGILWRMLPMYILVSLLAGLRSLFTRPADWLGEAAAHIWLATHPLWLLRQRRKWRGSIDNPQNPAVWLSGQVRGQGGLLNRLSLAWCRLLKVPCLEQGNSQSGVHDDR